MAAGDFGASEIQVAQLQLREMFATPTTAQTEMAQGAAVAARALLTRQKARTVPRLVGNKCVGVEAWFMRPHAAVATAPLDCEVPCGDEAESIKQAYNTTTLAASKAKVEDNRCDNHVMFQDELTLQMEHMMAIMRKTLNRSVVIPTISAASQSNLDTLLPAAWDDTTNAPRITVPEADFTFSNLNEFQIIAANNNFGNFFFLSGRLFNDDVWMANLNRMNEGERNAFLAWAQREIYFDTRDLDQTMTRKTAFAIDENSYAFWNTVRSTSIPTEITSNNGQTWTWVEADPILRWNDNGRLRPVEYEFEMQKTCIGRDAQEFRRNQYCLYGRLLGGFETAPVGPNAETGVLQFSIS